MRANAWVEPVLVLALVVVANLLGSYLYFRIDLTEDQRYTLSPKTEALVEGLEGTVSVTCYLDGDLPAGFGQLRNSIMETLDELAILSGHQVVYEFLDPYELAQGKERADLFVQLQGKGLKSFELEDLREDEIVHKIVWPAAFVRLGEAEVPVSFLRDQMGMSPEMVLHNSVMGVEYELANAIAKLQEPIKKKIAFVVGHGELSANRTADIANELGQSYLVERVDLTKYKVGKLEEYHAAIIAQPDSTFSDVDKYKIDQYLVKGGKVLWFLESLVASMDSLRNQPHTTTLDYPHQVRDLLFKYGVRVNLDLVQDYNCHTIPVFAGSSAGGANFRPWPYYPLVSPETTHPIVKNLGLVWFQFANSIDTLPSPGIRKTVLIKSSANSRTVQHPHRITLDLARIKLEPALFSKGGQNLAVLLEGKFTSFYKNRLAPSTLQNPDYGSFTEIDKPGKLLVVSDGDVIGNHVNPLNGQKYALGYDRFTGKSFGNKSFVMNCADYMLDDRGLFELRGKDYKLRMLDQAEVKEKRAFWQQINLVAPLLVLALAGLGYTYFRRRRFGKQAKA
ncbi:MAG: gliding motility-associated ABC transporter substrate-binding protein GldG [Bacteroidetes bacterium]|nr:gliding motility-associated ABC transporter substrate-binding protein GldG [Bacteroidota bacterium]